MAKSNALQKIESHEKLCRIMQKLTHKKIHSIEERVKRLEKILLTCSGALITGMAFLIYTLVSHLAYEEKMSKPLRISEEAAVQMPMKTVASLIALVAIGTWAFFGIQEKLNSNSTKLELMQKDLIENTEFRIKWPRGQLGSLPADSEQFMMIEDLYKTTDKLNMHIESMALNKINIEFLTKQLEKALEDIEELKDSNRDMHYKNGNGG